MRDGGGCCASFLVPGVICVFAFFISSFTFRVWTVNVTSSETGGTHFRFIFPFALGFYRVSTSLW